MPVRVALLTAVLAGPALAAPPLSPTADNTAILDEINAADPTITTTDLASIERLLAAAELAEARLMATVEMKHVADLLALTATARKVAYARTSEPVHLCALLAAAEHVLELPDLSATLAAEATDLRDETRKELVVHPDAACMQASERVREPDQPPAPEQPRELTKSAETQMPPAQQSSRARHLTIAGSALLGTAALAAIALIPIQVRRARAYDDLAALIADVEQAGSRTPEQAQRMRDLGAVGEWTRAAKIGLGVSFAVLATVGAGLVVGGRLRSAPTRARLTPYGGPQGAGITLWGRF
ncbi:hypothetical protein [Nannocystis punicea]|uniref:Uncharacterized protein n=1 Tax=Nannocystis punicea TaxID=2995304 RepID=A0ABY7HAV7_9BACT|nr:hypothetical protein [Nannocystis poenicansa]WAS96404.1 hypothetical protein O0S08_09615 [Nannocystis poenicansa]